MLFFFPRGFWSNISWRVFVFTIFFSQILATSSFLLQRGLQSLSPNFHPSTDWEQDTRLSTHTHTHALQINDTHTLTLFVCKVESTTYGTIMNLDSLSVSVPASPLSSPLFLLLFFLIITHSVCLSNSWMNRPPKIWSNVSNNFFSFPDWQMPTIWSKKNIKTNRILGSNPVMTAPSSRPNATGVNRCCGMRSSWAFFSGVKVLSPVSLFTDGFLTIRNNSNTPRCHRGQRCAC